MSTPGANPCRRPDDHAWETHRVAAGLGGDPFAHAEPPTPTPDEPVTWLKAARPIPSKHPTGTNVMPQETLSLFSPHPMLATAGAVLCLGMGLLGALFPVRAARFVSVQPLGGLGLSEIRATYGGLFIAMGVTCLMSQSPQAFLVAGASWTGAGLMRFPSLLLDRGSFPKGLGGAALELGLGLLLLCGAA